jgi:L-ascorbate metabolism protein UlaG (beta-lactamase superfamily)
LILEVIVIVKILNLKIGVNIDILLITHKHPDHCYPEAIKIIQEKNKDLIILTNEINPKLTIPIHL